MDSRVPYRDSQSPSIPFRIARLFVVLLILILFLIAMGCGVLVGVLVAAPDIWLSTTIIEIIQLSSTEQTAASSRSNTLRLLIDISGIAGSLAVSLALAAIYLSQNRILRKQTDIQTQQANIMRQQRLPLLSAHSSGVQLHSDMPELVEEADTERREIKEGAPDGPWASVIVENHGDEAAEQIHLACLIDIPATDDSYTLLSGTAPMSAAGMSTEPPIGKGALIPPTPGLTLLRARPQFSREASTGTQRALFGGELADQLLEEGNRVRFGFVLIYTNSMDQQFTVRLKPAYSAQPESFSDLSRDDFTMSVLTDQAGIYQIDKLIEDLDWEIPNDIFQTRE